ncbi:hypothetical protein C8R44DRAFT_623082 [Mycena epipterygia]|nr:hypothetical protein C8R44DRAFT_623082 [Mycena epipterygia]
MSNLIRESELDWFEHWLFLEMAGYRLRPKFQPGFVPIIIHKSVYFGGRVHGDTTGKRTQVMDAERISDGNNVMLKRISKQIHPFEVEIGKLFSSSPLSEDPRNHCISILAVLQDPDDHDKQIIVMPRLMSFYKPIFYTV